MASQFSGLRSPRRTSKSAFFFSAAAAILMLVLAACGNTGTGDVAPNATPEYGGSLNVGLTADAVKMDPLNSSSLYDRQVMLNLYDTLLHLDKDGLIKPNVATNWEYQDNGKTLIFTLQDGIKFTDGSDLDAAAVAFNIDRILKAGASGSTRYTEISKVDSTKVIDKTHVQFNLKAPFAPLLAQLTDRAGLILNPKAIQDLGDKLTNTPINAGSGPFTFVEWNKGDHLTLKRNPNYWQKDATGQQLPYLDQINYRPISDGSVMYANLDTGNLDAADSVDPNSIASAEKSQNITYIRKPGLSFYGLYLNTKDDVMQDKFVRQAISWAINRNEIVENVFKQNGVVSNGPVSPANFGYDASFVPYQFDVDKAKQVLAQSPAVQAGEKISFKVIYQNDNPTLATEVQFIQAQLQKIGVEVIPDPIPYATVLERTSVKTINYQVALLGWSGRPDPDGNFTSFFRTGGGLNASQYSNPAVDSLLDQAQVATEQNQRIDLYRQAQKTMMDDAPFVFIHHGVAVQATAKNIQNFTVIPTNIMEFKAVWQSK